MQTIVSIKSHANDDNDKSSDTQQTDQDDEEFIWMQSEAME